MLGPQIFPEAQPGYVCCTPYYIGVNSIFLPLIPYTLATALHDTHLEVALVLGTAFSGAIILLGPLLKLAGGYRTWPRALELAMLVVNAVLLGVSYPYPDEIAKYHNFISNSIYAAFGVLSIMFGAPFTRQYVREFVPPSAAGHDKVSRAAHVTSGGWILVFVTNTLIYLVPVCRNREQQHSHALNLVFRIILPIFLALFAAIFTRVWPLRVLNHLLRSQGFDAAPPAKMMTNPLAMTRNATALTAMATARGMGYPQQQPMILMAPPQQHHMLQYPQQQQQQQQQQQLMLMQQQQQQATVPAASYGAASATNTATATPAAGGSGFGGQQHYQHHQQLAPVWQQQQQQQLQHTQQEQALQQQLMQQQLQLRMQQQQQQHSAAGAPGPGSGPAGLPPPQQSPHVNYGNYGGSPMPTPGGTGTYIGGSGSRIG
ncbi:hypothetical protein Agub_g13109 [Astrephomene gubernaculifera]|uniref:Uncharacterized protein n=1 Tax=Astrephomene gubernaculifera TaxID=47775 RepID=A0AAD3E3R5_9CHLO|nr:hypothetical protein Agub_g13109 [Astrephomene gubernaculifera]